MPGKGSSSAAANHNLINEQLISDKTKELGSSLPPSENEELGSSSTGGK